MLDILRKRASFIAMPKHTHAFTCISARKNAVPGHPDETEIVYHLESDTGRDFTVYVGCNNQSTGWEVHDAINAALALFEYALLNQPAEQEPRTADDEPARFH